MPRTAAEVGAIVAARRTALGLRQDALPGISSALVRQIERGTAPPGGRAVNRAALTRALGWPTDALERLAAGEDPAALGDDDRHRASILDALDRNAAREAEGKLDDADARLDRLERQVAELADLTRRTAQAVARLASARPSQP